MMPNSTSNSGLRAKIGPNGTLFVKGGGGASLDRLLASLPGLPGKAKYNPSQGLWRFLDSPAVRQSLKGAGCVLVKTGRKGGRGKELDLVDLPFRNYQKRGAQTIFNHNGTLLLGDEPGLGKTIQTIGYLRAVPAVRPVLVVCPASLKFVWEDECAKWGMPGQVLVVEGGPRPDTVQAVWGAVRAKGLVIINYEVISKWVTVLSALPWQQIVLDESHYIKNYKAKRTKAVMMIGRRVSRRLCLSGTPIVNRPEEGFTTFQLLDPTMFPSRWDYLFRYCAAKRNHFGWDTSGASNIPELHEKITASLMLRRLKKDVEKQLPEKQPNFVPLPLDNRAEYNRVLRDTDGLARMEALKQCSVNGRYAPALQWVEDFLSGGRKLVVFIHHIEHADRLMADLKKWGPVRVTGGMGTVTKRAAVAKFQTNPRCRLLIGNLKAAGVGITLTAASDVAFLELPWSPGDLSQCIDRVHRIGQTAGSVGVHFLVGHKTIDEYIARMLFDKMIVLDGMLDGQETDTSSLMADVMKRIASGAI